MASTKADALDSAILTVNTGSSSVKLALFATNNFTRIWTTGVACDVSNPHEYRDRVASALAAAKLGLGDRALVGIGHRIVHGGVGFDRPVFVDAAIEAQLVALTPLAPLHMPLNLAGLRLSRALYPETPQVAAFDTAFHRTMPDHARMIALPRALRAKGVTRFGFHGLSYEYIVQALRDSGVRLGDERIVIAHLGAGASLCAVAGGRSVETTMGFSTLSGLPMATRCGDVDPGALLYLLRQDGMSIDALERMLYRESGLKGISGQSGDMKELLARNHDPAANGAVEHFYYQARRQIGALAAALGGLDRLVFTGGVGANSAHVRERICDGLGFLGVALDPERNDTGGRLISADDALVVTEAMATNEELMIALHVSDCLASRP